MADSNTIEVLRLAPGAVAEGDWDALRAMRTRAFEGMLPEPDAEQVVRLREQDRRCWVEGHDMERGSLMHAVVVQGRWVAAAHTFVRTIATPTGDLKVLALGVGVSVSDRSRPRVL